MRETFNCHRSDAFCLGDDQKDVPEFEDTDIESDDMHEEGVLLASDCSSGGSTLHATDDEKFQPKGRRSYSTRQSGDDLQFLGMPVCARACARLLGVGQTTLQKLRQGEEVYTMKNRRRPPKHPTFGFSLQGETGMKWIHVVMYFYFLYHSSAEFMPTDFTNPFKKDMKGITSETPFPGDDGKAGDNEKILRSFKAFMAALHVYNSDVDVHLIGPGFFKGERRALPHGSRTELYYEYRAYCAASNEDAPASFSTFLRVANKIMGPNLRNGQLRFREKNEHAKCDVCVKLKQRLRFRKGSLAANGPEDENAVYAYTSHVLSQWLDRQVYWSMRTLSQAYFRKQRELGDRNLVFF